MAELWIQAPGQPGRSVALSASPAVIGRGDDCAVQILEIRSSRRHARLVQQPGGGWALEDLGSSNGTIVGTERVLRRGLAPGDVIKIGETTLEYRAPEAAVAAAPVATPPVPAIGGRIRLEEVRPGDPPPAAAAPAPRGPSPRRQAGDAQALQRGIVFLAIGLAVLVGVETFVPKVANQRKQVSREAQEYTALLGRADLPFETFAAEVDAFRAAHPASRHLADLDPYVEERRAQHERLRAAEEELERVQRQGDALPASEALARLIALRRKNPDSTPDAERLRRRLDLAMQDLARRSASRLERDVDVLLAEVEGALGRSDPAAALRALSAFHARHPAPPEATRARLFAKEESVVAEVRRLANEAIAKAGETADVDARRELLAKALAGLAGTIEEDRLLGALRAGVPGGGASSGGPVAGTRPPPSGAPSGASGPDAAGPAPGAGTPPAPPTPPEPTVSPAVVAKAAEAERLATGRAWGAAADAYASLAKEEAPAALRVEWAERSDELRRVASLVADLQAAIAAAGERPLRHKLEDGVVELVAASADGLTVRRKDELTARAWASLSPAETLLVLARPKPTPDQRLAVALLAADLGDRAAVAENLIPLVEVESHRDLAFRTVARRLEGRKQVPQGGYVVDGRDLVDRAELARRVEARRIAALEAEAASIVGKLAAEPAYKKVDAVREKRDELDRRRAYALLAIFNETHYPYPKEPQNEYNVVQAEIDRRIAAVEEIWADPVSAHPGKVPQVRKLLARHAQVVEELRKAERDVGPLLDAVRPYALHATADPITVRTFARDQAERDLLEYNHWVMTQWNPFKTEVATEPERAQTRITNEYRMMMGWALRVEAGPASIRAIESASVAKILDAARETGRTPLYAVRIDERLVRAARGHSEDMGRRGYFAHEGRPDPAKGLPATTPFDRMAAAGYSGGGASENIANGHGDPMGAHMAWRHSSGHHRNLLWTWVDMGAGQSGSLWTQNFGVGGAGPPEIPGRQRPANEETPSGVEPSQEPAPDEAPSGDAPVEPPAGPPAPPPPDDAPPKDGPPSR